MLAHRRTESKGPNDMRSLWWSLQKIRDGSERASTLSMSCLWKGIHGRKAYGSYLEYRGIARSSNALLGHYQGVRFEREGRVAEHLHRVVGSNIFISMLLSSATGHQSSTCEAIRALQPVAREYKRSLDLMEMYYFTRRSRMSSPS